MRGSSTIFFMAASRVALSGHSTHAKATVSSAVAWTARRKSVTLPSGHRRPILDHTNRAQLDEQWVEMTRVLDELLLVGGWNRDHETVDVGHALTPAGLTGRRTRLRAPRTSTTN